MTADSPSRVRTLPQRELAAFCRRNCIQKLSLFGSVLREDFRPDSDVDVLVEFNRRFGLFHLARTQMFLEEILAEKIDLVPRNSIFPQLRDTILGEAVDVP